MLAPNADSTLGRLASQPEAFIPARLRGRKKGGGKKEGEAVIVSQGERERGYKLFLCPSGVYILTKEKT